MGSVHLKQRCSPQEAINFLCRIHCTFTGAIYIMEQERHVFILSSVTSVSSISIFITLLFIQRRYKKGRRYEWGKLPINKNTFSLIFHFKQQRQAEVKLIGKIKLPYRLTSVGIMLFFISLDISLKFISKKVCKLTRI